MKRAIAKILILAIALFVKKSNCQNLVKNYSFEDTIACPKLTCSVDDYVLFWRNPTGCSPDYYNTCDYAGACNVPYALGYQLPKSGEAYCGIYAFTKNTLTREYIQGELYDTLITNKRYCVSLWVNLSNSSRYSISNIGAYFSMNLINDFGCDNMGYIPHIENNNTNQLYDTLSWQLVYGEFYANGGEKYITIGNFRNDNSTDTVYNNNIAVGTGNFSYYYIDDVSVICCDCEDTSATTSNNLFIPNAFSPNNDGHNDVLRVLGNAKKIEFKVFDRWGEMVYSYTGGEMGTGTGWDGSYKGKALDNAVFVYFAKVTLLDGKEVEMKGNVSLIK